MLKSRLAIDLLDDRLVMHIIGKIGAAAFGRHYLRDDKIWDPLMQKLRELENLKAKGQVLLPSFSNIVRDVGNVVFEEIFRRDTMNPTLESLYSRYTNPATGSSSDLLDLSVSFMMEPKFFNLPIELMRDGANTPVATRIPVYKTVTTQESYPRRKEPFEADNKGKIGKIKVLLISSNTCLQRGEKVVIGGGEPQDLQLYLKDVKDLDEPHNEIDEIRMIIEKAKNKKGRNIEAEVIHTNELDYETFQKKLKQNRYDVIHYSGHGYHDDSYDSSNSSIFVWRTREKKQVVAINRDELRNLLVKQENLKLVYLSCCQGAKFDEHCPLRSNNFMGLLDTIALAGVPNVLGMRWSISPSHAKDLASWFYHALFLDNDHNTIEAALVKTRAKALPNNNQSVWCSPVLVKQSYSPFPTC